MPARGGVFQYLPPAAGRRRCKEPSLSCLLIRLTEFVAEPFGELTGMRAVAAAADGLRLDAADAPGDWLRSLCGCDRQSEACDRVRRRHAHELARDPRPHWHRCRHDNWCGIVPVCVDGRCLAFCRVMAPSAAEREEFVRAMRLLCAYVEGFVARERALLAAVAGDGHAARRASTSGKRRASTLAPDGVQAAPMHTTDHPLIAPAIAYIEQHLADTSLSVARVAEELGTNASYLAHVFAERTGTRMRQYITARRIELAKKLLATTNWQIKRVAFESGHAGAAWFAQVFRECTGETPSAYRRRHRPPS